MLIISTNPVMHRIVLAMTSFVDIRCSAVAGLGSGRCIRLGIFLCQFRIVVVDNSGYMLGDP